MIKLTTTAILIPLLVSAAMATDSETVEPLASELAGETGLLDGVGEPLDRDLPEGWYVELVTTHGVILARLLPEQAPQAVAHFVGLATGRLEWPDPFTGEKRHDPHYDGVEVHKVASAERFETGDRTGSGHGGAPFYLPQEGFGPVDFTYAGRLGMGRASLGRISGSMFFVTAGGQPWFNGKHPCFGVVVEGSDVVDRICGVKASSIGRPLTPIVLETARIFRVGNPAPLPDPERHVPRALNFRVRDDLEGR